MITPRIGIRALSLTTVAILFLVSFRLIFAQPQDVMATVQFSSGQSATATSFSDPFAVQPNEVVNVSIQFPADNVGESVKIDSLDGSQVSNATGVIATDGVVSFRFQATPNAGLNRLVVHHGAGSLKLKFWVLNPDSQSNPPVVAPANQEG